MTRQRLLACLLMGAAYIVAGSRDADAVLVTISTEPASFDPLGYTKFTFMIDPTVGGPTGITGTVRSFEAHFTMMTGVMNQINPSGETIFKDDNADIISSGANPMDDSQFEFFTSEWTETPSSLSDESPTLLEAVASIKLGAPLNNAFPLAHVVAENTAMGKWMIELIVVNGQVTQEDVQMGPFSVLPEASQVFVGSVAMIGLLAAYLIRRLSNRKLIASVARAGPFVPTA